MAFDGIRRDLFTCFQLKEKSVKPKLFGVYIVCDNKYLLLLQKTPTYSYLIDIAKKIIWIFVQETEIRTLHQNLFLYRVASG